MWCYITSGDWAQPAQRPAGVKIIHEREHEVWDNMQESIGKER